LFSFWQPRGSSWPMERDGQEKGTVERQKDNSLFHQVGRWTNIDDLVLVRYGTKAFLPRLHMRVNANLFRKYAKKRREMNECRPCRARIRPGWTELVWRQKTEHFMQSSANKSSPKEMNINKMNSSGNATYCFFKHVIGQMLLALTLRVIFRSPSNHTCATLQHPQNKF